MPKTEKETRETKGFLPYDRAEPQSRTERKVEMKNRTLHYYQWDKINIEQRLASEKGTLQKLLAAATEMEQQLAASETCPDENCWASLRRKYEWVINRGIAMHQEKIAYTEKQLKYANFRIKEIKSWLAEKTQETDAITLELSAMLISCESESESKSKEDEDEDEDDTDADDNENDAGGNDDAAGAVADEAKGDAPVVADGADAVAANGENCDTSAPASAAVDGVDAAPGNGDNSAAAAAGQK